LDRALRPYFEELAARLEAGREIPPPSSPPAGSPPLPDFILHNALHSSRTLALWEMPPGAKTLLSSGPNGRWYFDWIEQAYGAVERHIAVEAYTPRPDDLPDEVEWVEADIAAPGGIATVADGEVDMVFSGQNIEHLWPEQVVRFLVESSRVLKPGGWLVVDSPNRALTAHYRWSMSEHTVEFTPDEAAQLFSLAGFEVRSMKGLWRCRVKGRLVDLDPDPSWMSETNLERMATGFAHPDDCFLWWAECVKVGHVDVSAIREELLRIYSSHWDERVDRSQAGEGLANPAGDAATIEKGRPGYLAIGPYMPLPAGRWTFSKEISWAEREAGGEPIGALEVVGADRLIVSTPVHAEEPSGTTMATCTFDLPELTFAVHARVHSTGLAHIEVPFALSIEPDPWRLGLSAESPDQALDPASTKPAPEVGGRS